MFRLRRKATVCPRLSQGSAGTASHGGLRRGCPAKKRLPRGGGEGGGGGCDPSVSRPTVCFLTPTVSTSPSPPSPPPLPPLFTLLHHSLSFSPLPRAHFFSACLPPELCAGAARADSFDLRAVHVVEIRGPAALPSRRSRNGALARENKPLFSGAAFFFLCGETTARWRGEGGAVSQK